MATLHFIETQDGWVGFGEWLRQTREARGLTLDDIMRETKIPRRNLEALERGNLGVVPAFYQRAEVRAIARAVGVDEGVAVGRLESAIAPPVEPARPRVPAAGAGLPAGAVYGVLALGALVLIAMQTGRALFNSASTPPPVAPAASTLAPSDAGSQPSMSLEADTVGAGAAVLSSEASTADVALAVDIAEPAAEVSPLSGGFTELVVRTEPAGARVTVNGIGWGVSPVVIRLPPGEKHVRVTKEGFAGTERALALGEGERRELDFSLSTAN
jgi:transcriptional regulator with XRE-family HTH domain